MKRILRLRVTQKSLRQSFLLHFFSFSFSLLLMDGLAKVLFHFISSKRFPLYFIIMRFRMNEHDLSCPLEKIVMVESSEFVETCFSTTKNMSPLPECLWPPNLAGWWLAKRGSHDLPRDPLITWPCKITWQAIAITSFYRNVYCYKT